MDKTTNALNWFEIPVADIDRAKTFYENIFGVQMESTEMMGMKMAFFPGESDNGKASGGLVQSQMHTPSQEGAVIYLNANPNMQPVLDKIETNGGKIAMQKTEIPNVGYMGFFIDTEGNKLGLHSNE